MKNIEQTPMVMIDLRAQIEDCNPAFLKVLAVFNLKAWKGGKKSLTNKEIAAYSGLKEYRVKYLTAAMHKKSWLDRHRKRGGTYVYEKTIPVMEWEEAHSIARLRLTGDPQQEILVEKVPRGTFLEGGTNHRLGWENPSPRVVQNPTEGGTNHRLPNSIKDSLKEPIKDSLKDTGADSEPAPPTKASKKPPWTSVDGHSLRELTDAYSAVYMAFKGQLGPKTDASEQASADLHRHIKKGVRALVAHALEKGFNFEEYLRRLRNLPRHSFAVKKDLSLVFFLSNNSEFADGSRSLDARASRFYAAPSEGRREGED